MVKHMKRLMFPSIITVVYGFLYVPLLILIIFSFNDNRFRFDWVGFTTKWYQAVWETPEIWQALNTSLIVAFSTVFFSLSLSALFVFFGSKRLVRNLLLLFYLNLAIPEVVLAVGLMTWLYLVNVPLSITTLIAAHTVLGLGYVIPILYDRYTELDQKFMEASLDLGATPWQTFRRVVLPLMYPSLLASGLLVFIISFDDFVLSFFCAGGATQTLPMYIYAIIRAGTSPVVSALSTILLCVSCLLMILFVFLRVGSTEEIRR